MVSALGDVSTRGCHRHDVGTDRPDDALGFLFEQHAEKNLDHPRDSSRALRYMSAASSPMCLRSYR